jgi:predicted DCC family thiol-disulfide oxidoreductase YuxK
VRKSAVHELTVLYDEGCGFCTEVARWLGRRPGVSVAPIGSETGSSLLRDLTLPERYDSVHVVDGLGRRLSAGASLPPLLRTLPGGRAPAAMLEAFPSIAELGYRLVSGHRALAGRIVRALRRTAGAAT